MVVNDKNNIPGYRFAKLELSWGSKPTGGTGECVDTPQLS